MTDADRLRQQQQRLRLKLARLSKETIETECELIRVDRQLGEINDYNQPGSGGDTTGVP